MAFRDHLRVLSRRWRVIALVTVLGTGTGLLDSALTPPVYRATVTLFVSVQDGGDVHQLVQQDAFVRERVHSYVEAATGPAVTGPVVDSLRLPMTRAQLAERITAEAPGGTVLVRLSAVDSRAVRAALIGNAVADRFARVVARMERTGGRTSSPVRLTVLQPATVPSAPVSPDVTADTALALAVSLLVGTGLALAAERLRMPLRDTASLAECLSAAGGPSVLAGIARDPRAERHPVCLDDDANGPRAEGFRGLRVNLRFVQVDRRPKVIAVTSPLPGEGRSSVSLNLAATLAEQGARVCLVDGDLRRPSVARTLGLARDTGLTEALVAGAGPRELLRSDGSFAVLTSGPLPPDPARLLGGARFRSLLRALAEEFDHVVVDTPPVLPFADTVAMAGAVDGFLLVARAGRTGRSEVAQALTALGRTGVPVLGAVLNAVEAHNAPYGYGYGYGHGRGSGRAPGRPARAVTRLAPGAASPEGTHVSAGPRRPGAVR
ncbi:polysaccharide biosynthesis tyrosine autokinase [Streptomyces sp. NPDC047022]|uniref:polysaccharide biosynthesis tyrosine autokinase n=1 Tax=Streptomyces sp. NPDC047022 TaxID=3155737 RepID=UPI0033E9F282